MDENESRIRNSNNLTELRCYLEIVISTTMNK
jgi:hypothetical protein